MLPSITDPFDVAKDVVQGSVQKVKAMHKDWKRKLETENTAESRLFQDLHAELLGELQQLDYDLQEVERSITTVEENRDRFKLDEAQLTARREFARSSRASHREVREELGGRRTAAKMESDRRELLMRQKQKQEVEQKRHQDLEDEAFLQEQRQLQRQLVDAQEDELNTLSKTTEMLGVAAHTINGELETQQKMLDELNQEFEMESEKMNVLMKGAGQVLKTNNRWQIGVIAGMILLFFLLLWLFLNT
mmetsp:Transcript_91655/g.259607  ORF Transcript_91655/g.259607 Transcript_91655/m.259607 type:complete len:248 (-) Transcript_91655:105-848(-)